MNWIRTSENGSDNSKMGWITRVTSYGLNGDCLWVESLMDLKVTDCGSSHLGTQKCGDLLRVESLVDSRFIDHVFRVYFD